MPRSKLTKVLARMAFALWIPVVLVPGSYLLARHVLTLPKPTSVDPILVDTIRTMRRAEAPSPWFAMHVLSAECGCSQRVLANLLKRRPLPGFREQIVLVGGDDPEVEKNARELGYGFDRVTSDELVQRYHLEAAPVMVVADAKNQIKYLGGYADRKQGEVIRDTDVLTRLVAGAAVEPLPLFGCAVSKRLQTEINPLGIR